MNPCEEGDRGDQVAPQERKTARHAGAPVRATVEEAADLVRRIGRAPGAAPIKVMIGRAADALGWTISRTKHVWYGTAHRITADEIDALRRTSQGRGQESG